jgi:hypothetical protein
MQPQPTSRSIHSTCIRRSLTVFALTLAVLALAMPLAASAADEKDDPRRDAPRREETPAAEVTEATVAPVETVQTHFVAADPDPGCPPGFSPALPPLNPELGCIPTDLDYVAEVPASDPDPTCPEGTAPAVPPLNPALGCLPTNAAAGSGGSDQIGPDPTCPEGWVPAVPPLNPALGCVAASEAIAVETEPQTATFAGSNDARHPGHDDCPPGWVPARSPLNEDLGCVNNTLTAGIVAGDATGGGYDPGAWGGDGSHHHPGHCPEGFVLKLLLKQNPDGSLTFFYGCVKEGGGIVTGPTDFTAGTAEPVVAHVAWTGPAIYTVEACPEGSARHPDYLEYGCIPFGSGPWAL